MKKNMKRVQIERKKYEDSATRKRCNMKQHEKSVTVQHEKRCNMKRVQYEKRCNMKRVQHEKSATQKQKYNLRRVEREKVEHEKSAT